MLRPYATTVRAAVNGFWPGASPIRMLAVFSRALGLTLTAVALDDNPNLVITSVYGSRKKSLAAIRNLPNAAHVFFTGENCESDHWKPFADHLSGEVDAALGFYHKLSSDAPQHALYVRWPLALVNSLTTHASRT